MQTFEQLGITEKPDQEDVIERLVQRLELTDMFNKKKPTKSDRKITSLETRQVVSKSWYDKSTHSTLISRPARLKVSDKGKIQTSPDFVSMVNIVSNKRGISFYENPWRITETTVKALYTNFILTFPDHEVGYGTFLALKPFYVRGATNSDLEMCCCKLHLHARWSIKICTLLQ